MTDFRKMSSAVSMVRVLELASLPVVVHVEMVLPVQGEAAMVRHQSLRRVEMHQQKNHFMYENRPTQNLPPFAVFANYCSQMTAPELKRIL
jgi:hypothetical protein